MRALPYVILDMESDCGPETCSPPQVDGIWLWVYYDKVAICRIFYLLKGDYNHYRSRQCFSWPRSGSLAVSDLIQVSPQRNTKDGNNIRPTILQLPLESRVYCLGTGDSDQWRRN